MGMRKSSGRQIREVIASLTPGQCLTLANQAKARIAENEARIAEIDAQLAEINAQLAGSDRATMPAKPFKLKAQVPTEAQVQNAILRYLAIDRRVLWAERMNSGKGKLLRPDGSQTWIRFGFAGCPDIMGQLRDGRYLAVECKRAGGRVRPEQRTHISLAADHGAVALIARSVEDVQAALDAAHAASRPLPYAEASQALLVASEPATGHATYPFPIGD